MFTSVFIMVNRWLTLHVREAFGHTMFSVVPSSNKRATRGKGVRRRVVRCQWFRIVRKDRYHRIFGRKLTSVQDVSFNPWGFFGVRKMRNMVRLVTSTITFSFLVVSARREATTGSIRTTVGLGRFRNHDGFQGDLRFVRGSWHFVKLRAFEQISREGRLSSEDNLVTIHYGESVF